MWARQIEQLRQIERLRMLGQTNAALRALEHLGSSGSISASAEWHEQYWLLRVELAALSRSETLLPGLLHCPPSGESWAALADVIGAYLKPNEFSRGLAATSFVQHAEGLPSGARDLGGLYVAKILSDVGDRDGARSWCADAMAGARESCDDARLAFAVSTAGEIEFRDGNLAGALELFDLASTMQSPVSEMQIRLGVVLGITLLTMGSTTEAETCFHEALHRAELTRHTQIWAFRGLLWCLAWRCGSAESTNAERRRARIEYAERRRMMETLGRVHGLLAITDAFLASLESEKKAEKTHLQQAAVELDASGDTAGAEWCRGRMPASAPVWTAAIRPRVPRQDACDRWLFETEATSLATRYESGWAAWQAGRPDWMQLFF